MRAQGEGAHFFGANRLLAGLPSPDYTRLRAVLEPVRLAKGVVLYDVGESVRYAYFLTGGMVSLLGATESSALVQVAMVGDEGVVGIPAFLRVNVMPYRVTVQLPTTALRIRASVLSAEVNSCGSLTDALLRYLHMLVTQITQSAVCNRYHTIEERLCRWLLLSRDRARSDVLPLTQETLAHMLGVQRTGVTAAAGALQRKGLLSYRRGKIRLLDERGIKVTACECYRVVSEGIAQFMAA
jgi:CRP-like cAMP-binding protein